MKDITVRGQVVTNQTITGFTKKANSLNDMFTVWANAAVLQAAQHGNRNWIDALFAVPLLRLANGDLNKTGKQVLSYIQAHFPRVEWDKDGQKPVLKKYNAKSPYCMYFAAPGLTLEQLTEVAPVDETSPVTYSYKDIVVTVQLDKILLPQGDFLLTFDEFCNLPKPEKEDKPEASIKAVTFSKTVAKVIEAQSAAKFVGSPEELADALAKVKDLYMILSAAQGQAVAAATPIDTAKADELHKSGQNGKSARAGGKVDKTTAVAA